MDRAILHVDCNSFYISVESIERPELKKVPAVVGGREESRHGIVLTKNELAKRYGISTGESLWEARQKCPSLTVIPPDYEKYVDYSSRVRTICQQYSDRVEAFGLDECWLDCSGSAQLFGDGPAIARTIGHRVREELGITVSVGVSWNKIYAKLGSDYQKPDAVTVFDRQNYRSIIWPMPARSLLYVGPATERKLKKIGIYTIGQIAEAEPFLLRQQLGKWGEILSLYARGEDTSPVCTIGTQRLIKSIGNSTTTPRDLVCDQDVRTILYILAEAVCARLRKQGLTGGLVSLYIRDKSLESMVRQKKLARQTNINDEVFAAAMSLFMANYHWEQPIRSLGIQVSDLWAGDACLQLDLFTNEPEREKRRRLDAAVDALRQRYGNNIVRRAEMLEVPDLLNLDPEKAPPVFDHLHTTAQK